MPAYSLMGGVSTWAAGALTDEARATTYADARLWADWGAKTAPERQAAILDASTWVRSVWTPPSTYSVALDEALQDAVTDAARLALAGPLMGGAAAGGAQRLSITAGSVGVTYAEKSAAQGRSDRLALVSAMLRATGATSADGMNIRLSRA